MTKKRSKLAIFDTFKTNPYKMTGEATRQRAIIKHLTNATNSSFFEQKSVSEFTSTATAQTLIIIT